MFRKLNPKRLILVVGILLGIVIIVELINSGKDERSFRSDLVEIDTSKVTEIFLYPRAENFMEIKISRLERGWQVEHRDQVFDADRPVIYNLLSELMMMKPERVAANDETRWEEFEVSDSTGVRVKVYENRKITADVIIGKFSYQQPSNPYMQRQGKMTTYVRLTAEPEVYAVNGFLSMTFNRDVNSFRNKDLVKADKYSWTQLTFMYPADSSFILTKQNDKWMINGLLADSTETNNYLNALARVSSPDFVNDSLLTEIISPMFSLTIEGNNLPAPIEIFAFPADTTNKYIITSSINQGAGFSGSKSGLFEKIFISREKLFGEK